MIRAPPLSLEFFVRRVTMPSLRGKIREAEGALRRALMVWEVRASLLQAAA
jgi:uncharacterized membrane protein YjfL (UPF0719 family)